MEMLHRLHSVIAFDRESVGDPRKPPNTLAAAFGALNAANAKYLRTFNYPKPSNLRGEYP